MIDSTFYGRICFSIVLSTQAVSNSTKYNSGRTYGRAEPASLSEFDASYIAIHPT